MICKRHSGSPIDYLPQRVIPGDKLFVMERARSYLFGVLTSNVHMAWMRAVAGRLEMRYRYSAQTLFYPVLCPLRAPLGMVSQARWTQVFGLDAPGSRFWHDALPGGV